MTGIALLAQVERPVVSSWRKRYADGDDRFPSPTGRPSTRGEIVFDLADVAGWLRKTGRGNNEFAADEAPLFSSMVERVLARFGEAAELLSLEPLLDDTIANASRRELHDALHRRSDVLALQPSVELAGQSLDALRADLDVLTEAAVSSAGALLHLARTARSRPAAAPRDVRETQLSTEGAALVRQLMLDAVRTEQRPVVPLTAAALVELLELVASEDAPEHLAVHVPGFLAARADLRPWLWAVYLQGCDIELCPDPLELPAGAFALALAPCASWAGFGSTGITPAVDDPCRGMAELDDALTVLDEGQVVVAIAPSAVLVDQLPLEEAEQRMELLAPHTNVTMPLRYVARLQENLVARGGLRRLGMWAFAHTDRRDVSWYAELSNTQLDPAVIDSIVSDVWAATAGTDTARRHAFTHAQQASTATFLRGGRLTLTPADSGLRDGRELHAKIDQAHAEAEGDLFAGLDISSKVAAVGSHTVTWDTATKGVGPVLGLELAGVRLDDSCHDRGPATVQVIGRLELRGQSPVGARRLDRLRLEELAPHARLTERGDVVFHTQPPCALVDWRGGSVVEAPARVFRCLRPDGVRRMLDPAVVAADIASQRGRDRHHWLLRTVPHTAVQSLAMVTERIETERRHLRAKLRALNDVTTHLHDGLAAGVLTLSPVTISDSVSE